MFKKLLVLGILAGLAVQSNAAPSAEILAQKTQAAVEQGQQPGLKRFDYMRFFMPTNAVPETPGLWERLFSSSTDEAHTRALAIYLFNMYVSTHMYQQTPAILTLNYLGVLDGLVRGKEPFNTAQATRFYQKHKQEINSLIRSFMHKRSYPWPAPTENEYLSWLNVLEKQPTRAKGAVYLFPANNLLHAPITSQAATHFTSLLNTATEWTRSHVVVYDTPDVQLEDLDTKFGNYQPRRKLTYRWIADECYYSTYLIGRLVLNSVKKRILPWHTRVYRLTALPKSGEFLTPAMGSRFQLANGQTSLRWRYHTALLVILPISGTYVPVVLDSFLAGKEPISTSTWLAHFSPNTVFSAVPFERDSTVEAALKTPQKQDGRTVWADGKKYQPADVIQ